MNRTLIVLAMVAALSNCALAFAEEDFQEPLELSSRQLFLFNSTSVTIGYTSFVLGLVALVGLAALLAVLAGLLGSFAKKEDSGSYYDTYGDSYARKVSFNPYAIDWDKFSILDWIAVGEEAYNKFDPADLECQKRLICEVHQNTAKFGLAAKRIVDIFSYLQYAEVLHLPEEIKALIEEYLDAADRGRNPQKECGDVFTTCDFSVKRIFDKFSQNEV